MSGSLFYASLSTETNSFSNIPTRYDDYAAEMRRGRDVLYDDEGNVRPAARTLLEFADARNLDVVASLSTSAAPGAPTDDDAYRRLSGEILDDLAAADDVRAVLLGLHGAMMSSSCNDCEGDILERIRRTVGVDVPVAAVLDPHAHLTYRMVEQADFLVFMKEYPHTDGLERTVEALDVIGALLDGGQKLSVKVVDCELLGFFPTNLSPMREFVDGLFEKERSDDVVSISFIHGFPWGDSPDVGAKVLVYTSGDEDEAQRVANLVRDEIWAIKDETMFETVTLDEAMGLIDSTADKPIVFGDVSDNPGGGAPGDSTFILDALISRGIRNVAVGCLSDPESVRRCHAAGVGEQVTLSIGGRLSEFSGKPVEVTATVRGIAEDAAMNVADVVEFPMGDTAWVTVDDVDIVMLSTRTQTYAPDAFTHLGVDLPGKAAIFVKSTNHFQAFFAELASDVRYLNTPGALDFDLSRIPYRVFDKPYYPRSLRA